MVCIQFILNIYSTMVVLRAHHASGGPPGGLPAATADPRLTPSPAARLAQARNKIGSPFWPAAHSASLLQPLLLPLCVRRRPERCTYLVPRLREARRRRRGLPRIGGSRRQAPRRAAGGNGEPGAPP